MNGSEVPAELSRLDAELEAGLDPGLSPAPPGTGLRGRRLFARRFELGSAAVVIGSGMAMLLFALTVPWVGVLTGFDALLGADGVGPLPRLFSWTAVGFGVLGSALALILRRWALAWLCALGCGFSIVDGVLAIWSRQTGSGAADAVGDGPGAGMVLAWFAVVLLTATWTKLAWSRPRSEPVPGAA